MYLRRERLIISNPYFMDNVHYDLIQVFVYPIGVIVESISNFIISWHCCAVSFWSKFWAKWAAKVSDFLSHCTFLSHVLEVLFHYCFEGVFECFPHKLRDIVCTLPCKLHNIFYIKFLRCMYVPFTLVVELQLHSRFRKYFDPIPLLILSTRSHFRISPILGNQW